jgi:hypothetical protein
MLVSAKAVTASVTARAHPAASAKASLFILSPPELR